jgi:hypothetical protein
MKTAVEWLIEEFKDLEADFKYSVIDYETYKSKQINLLEQAKEMEKQQQEDCWEIAHQAGRLEGKGIAEENWQTFETYWKENF